jgi:hypothetical protein
MSLTTVKIQTATRDRLNRLAAEHYDGTSMDKLLNELMDMHWRTTAIEQADRWRDEHPEQWRAYLADADTMDRQWSPNIHETEGPYRSDDPEWTAAGGPPLTTDKSVAA